MAAQSVIWVNGERDSALALPDRGLSYGDGLFETLLLHSGQILYLDTHLERLQRGMSALALVASLENVTLQLRQAADSLSGIPWAVMKLTLTRGAGPRGYRPPDSHKCHCIIEVSELPRDGSQAEKPARLGVADIRLASQPALAGFKHLNRLEQVVAAQQLARAGFMEGVMLDGDDCVVCVVAGNIFSVRGDHIETPALGNAGVAGTRRSLLMRDWAPALGMAVTETTMSLRDLEAADEVFYTNALVGVRSVASVGEVKFSQMSVARRLFQVYRAEQA